MASINYSFTNYRFTGRFSEPLPIEAFDAIRMNRSEVFKELTNKKKLGIKEIGKKYPVPRWCYQISKILFFVGIGSAFLYFGFQDGLSHTEESYLMSLMTSCYMVLIFTIVLSPPYWRSKRQFNIYSKSVERYFNIHTDLIEVSKNYDDYLHQVASKKEYLNMINRVRAYHESQLI